MATTIADGTTQVAWSSTNPIPVALQTGSTTYGATNPLPVITTPAGATVATPTQVINSSGNKAATSGTASIAGASGKTSYLTKVEFSGTGATATSIIAPTISDGTWTVTYELVVAAGVTGRAFASDVITLTFSPPLAASATNTAITATLPSLGSGSTNACVNAYGFQQ